MKVPIKVTVQNLSTGQELVRVYDSKNECLMKTNTLVVQMMSKFNVDEIFIRYEHVNDYKFDDLVEDLPFPR